MATERTRAGHCRDANTLRVFRQPRTGTRELSAWRGSTSHCLFVRTAGVRRKQKDASRPASTFRSVFRGVCRIALAVLDAYWIVGQIPHSPPDFREFLRNDPNREEPFAGESE